MTLRIARINNFLIIAGTDKALEPFRRTNATMLVDPVTDFKTFLLETGASVIRNIQQVPTGFNMTVWHKDGCVAEYVEQRQNS